MNLIEQLGGYEAAKAEGEKWGFDDFLNNQLLEYRRQHNIFEMGDVVVIRESLRYSAPNRLFKVYTKIKVYSDGSDSIYVSGLKGLVQMSTQYIRHATDEEIKAGRRL